MIQHFTPKDEFDLGRTTGCSCCSSTLNKKEDVLQEIKDNIRVAKEVSEFYKIPFEKLCKEVLTEKKCKKHIPYRKYNFREKECWNCIKCDKFLYDKCKTLGDEK